MVLRLLVFSFLLATTSHGAVVTAASSSSSTPRHLRASSSEVAAAPVSVSSEDIPDIVETRSLQRNRDRNKNRAKQDVLSAEKDATKVDASTESTEDVTAVEEDVTTVEENATDPVEDASTAEKDERDGSTVSPGDANVTAVDEEMSTLEEGVVTTVVDNVTTVDQTLISVEEDTATVKVSTECLQILLASANHYGKLKKENYYAFTDGMSNGYYSFNNMTSYRDLPTENKFAFVTLTCKCRAQGGRRNCCQGDRAKLDVSEVGDEMTTEMQLYINDICSVTAESIGDNKIPSTGRPTTASPTSSSAPTLSPMTSSPTLSPTENSPTIHPTTSISPSADALSLEVSSIVEIPAHCLNLLAATTNDYGKIRKESYFVFTDGMSNGYYSFNNMTEYSDLPMKNKFGFVTLSCRCHAMGGRENCCQGNRAKLDVSGIDDPESMPREMQVFLSDICSVTSDNIGENKLPPSGELPTTAKPTTSLAPTLAPTVTFSPTSHPTHPPSLSIQPSTGTPPITGSPTMGSPTRTGLRVTRPPVPPATSEPTASPVSNVIPEIVAPPNSGNTGSNSTVGGLPGAAWAGIAVAGVCVVTLTLYLLMDRGDNNDEGSTGDGNLDNTSQRDNGKGLPMLTITNGDKGEADISPPSSPDTTNTALSSIPSRSNNFAQNPLLPGLPNDGSMLSSSGDAIEEGVVVRTPRSLYTPSIASTPNTSNKLGEIDNIDEAIEEGRWEDIASSAAAIVKKDDSAFSSVDA